MYPMRVIISLIINSIIDSRSGVFLGLFAFLVDSRYFSCYYVIGRNMFREGEFPCHEAYIMKHIVCCLLVVVYAMETKSIDIVGTGLDIKPRVRLLVFVRKYEII